MGQIGKHQYGEVRLKISAQYPMKVQHNRAAQFAPSTLVGLAGVGEAIAQHPLAARQRRQNQLINVLGAVGEHQSYFCQRRKAGGA